MAKTLSGKVALVTGGSRASERRRPEPSPEEGADVAISYSASADQAKTVVADVEAKGVRAAAFQADQSDVAQAAGLIHSVVEHFGQLAILVNNAGVTVAGPIDARSPTRLRSTASSSSTTPASSPRSGPRVRCSPTAGGSSASAPAWPPGPERPA